MTIHKYTRKFFALIAAITYCGGGISASSNAFIMTRLGFTDVAVYISSLQEWANDLDNPLVTDMP